MHQLLPCRSQSTHTRTEFSLFVTHGDYVLLANMLGPSTKSYGPLSGECILASDLRQFGRASKLNNPYIPWSAWQPLQLTPTCLMQRGMISVSMYPCGAATAMLVAYPDLFPLHTSMHVNNTL